MADISLAQFYDEIIYWEMAKNSNRFFVTFEKGLYGIPNNKLESIGTSEITYPHINSNTGSSDKFELGVTRNAARYDVFLEEEEKSRGSDHGYDGYITTTELKGTRYFQSTLTSSKFTTNTYTYQVKDEDNASTIYTSTRTVSASYYYPYSSHQLSVLRKSPTLIIDLDKDNELPDGIGAKGFVLIPENTHPDIKANLDFYLEKAGYK